MTAATGAVGNGEVIENSSLLLVQLQRLLQV